MTNTRLDTEQTQSKLPKWATISITTVLMTTSMLLAALLLLWAVDLKLSNIPKVESSDITAELRERQLACLAKNIYYEAGSEPFEGKIAVAQVTLNRVESNEFPNDVCKTVYEKNIFYKKVVCQFSWYCDRVAMLRPIHKGNYNESMIAAKKVLLEGFRLPSLETALFYHATYINPDWNRKRIAQIGKHIFYE